MQKEVKDFIEAVTQEFVVSTIDYGAGERRHEKVLKDLLNRDCKYNYMTSIFHEIIENSTAVRFVVMARTPAHEFTEFKLPDEFRVETQISIQSFLFDKDTVVKYLIKALKSNTEQLIREWHYRNFLEFFNGDAKRYATYVWNNLEHKGDSLGEWRCTSGFCDKCRFMDNFRTYLIK